MYPSSVVWSFGGRIRTHRNDRAQRIGLDQSEVAERLHGPQRVVVELAPVVHAARARALHEVLVGEDLVPQRLHLGDLREEPMAADVEAPSVTDDGLADATDHVGALEHGARVAGLAELVGSGEAGGSGADDDDASRVVRGGVVVGGLGHSRSCEEAAARAMVVVGGPAEGNWRSFRTGVHR